MIISSEGIFYTVQGEGRYSGHPSVFLRLSYCNLRCAWKNEDGSETKCDTPHTSFYPEKIIADTDEIITKINSYKCSHVVITGGEPMMQENDIVALANKININKKITIETNGTIFCDEVSDRVFFSISPKLSSSGNNGKGVSIEVLKKLYNRFDCQFKFVVNSLSDINEILDITEQVKIKPESVYLMPQGISIEQINSKMPMVFELCKEYGFNYSDRLHIRAYGNKKGI